MATVRLELTVEPFVEGQPGPHVLAAIERLREAGLEPEVGPFGTAVEGEVATVTAALAAATDAAFDRGASAVSAAVRARPCLGPEAAAFVDAVSPLLHRLGAVLVDPDQMRPTDLPLTWDGQLVGAARPPEPEDHLHDMLARLISQVEHDFGGPLAELSREEKQRAALWLEQRGAFNLRNAVEVVADAMGVSRVTVYNYLSAVRARR